ncbi:hypothetical protein RXV86_13865 [Alisedimentitalea sp. MJ-SS2]|uniref:hypothetical protein n=1 Tax=Aliisedimentitalea sp. MJ-SS2 TaxID=3049795 RepID=UPI00290F9C58|nr:hypothetical protein [Alisedimentitalea sp. MJ-SS2]MDU8928472.1 hypothetical protein [Alisedimentitalea sp. MJ-SS2]
MLAKIVVLFLVFIAVLGMFGKLRVPGAKKLADKRCPKCGKFRIGRGPCNCDKKG